MKVPTDPPPAKVPTDPPATVPARPTPRRRPRTVPATPRSILDALERDDPDTESSQ